METYIESCGDSNSILYTDILDDAGSQPVHNGNDCIPDSDCIR